MYYIVHFNNILCSLLGWLIPGRDSKIFLESKASWAHSVEDLPQVSDEWQRTFHVNDVQRILLFAVTKYG